MGASHGDLAIWVSGLQLIQLWLAAHVHSTFAGSSAAIVGTLHDPQASVLGQSAQERDEAAAYGRRRV